MTTTYADGTVSVTNGSATVTGSGTAFETGLVTGGVLHCGGASGVIAAIVSDTEITLTRPWAGATLAGAGYDIVLESAEAARLVIANRQLADIIARLNTSGGVLWSFDTGTSDADPGAGKLRADNASLAAATQLFVSKTTRGGDDVSAYLLAFDDSSSAVKGQVTITDPSTEDQAVFEVTGVTDAAGYVKVAVQTPAGVTAFANATSITVQFSRTGDAGSLPATAYMQGVLLADDAVEARAALAVLQDGAVSMTTTAPPGGPASGDTYIVPAGATGAWAGQDGKVAVYVNAGWVFLSPVAGWTVWVADKGNQAVYQGGAWVLKNPIDTFALSVLQDSGRFAGAGVILNTTAAAFSFPSYMTLYNAAAAASAGKFIFDNDDYGGTGGALSATVKDLIDKIRDPAYRRYGIEFYVAEITAGAGTGANSVLANGDTLYLSMFNRFQVRPQAQTFHAYFRAIDDTVAFKLQSAQTCTVDGVEYGPSSAPFIVPADGWVSVTIKDNVDPYVSFGYQPNLISVYSKSGDRWQMACPAIFAGITDVDDNIGIAAANNSWPV